MSKELEALKRIRQETCPATILPDFDKEECCMVIETALKRLEQIDKVMYLNNRKLKALEIIKELLDLKVISVVNNDTRLIVRFGDVQYSLLVPNKYVDLLKEVLKDE